MILKQNELKKRLKDNISDNFYLFYGEEEYIKNKYIEQIKKLVLANDISNMNYIQYDEFPEKSRLIDDVESVPIMCDKKIVLFNSLNLLSSGLKKEIKTVISDILSDIPEYTVVIIKETVPEKSKLKSNAIYKLAEKSGVISEFDVLSQTELASFASKEFTKRHLTIQPRELNYLLSLCGSTVYSVLNEIEKISSYSGEEVNVTVPIIDLLVKRNVEDKVFDLFDCIISRNKKTAYNILNDLKLLKNQHPAGQIYSILCDNFINMYICAQNASERISESESAAMLGINPKRSFIIRKYVYSSKNISLKRLKNIISVLADMDYKIKNGLTDPYYAIEEIIAVF